MSVRIDNIVDEIDVDGITDLVERYDEMSEMDRRQAREAKVRQQFINPLLRALGWDTTTDQVLPEQRTLAGDADYALSLKGRVQFFIETKRFSEGLDGTRRVRGEEQSYVEQAIDYAWHQGCDWAVLTNFEEFRLYFTHVPKDRVESDGHVFTLEYDDYTTDDGLEKLGQVSKPAVERGSLEALERARDRDNVTDEILNVLSEARMELTVDVHESHGDELTMDEIRGSVQRILDRLVVMRVAEDRTVIPRDSLLQMVESWSNTTINPDVRTLVRDLKNAFRDFDSVYNSALFAEHRCEDLDLSNDVLEGIIDDLYEYNFAYIDADLLGSIYEDYLGHAIEDKQADSEDGEALELVSQADVKRESGIYYTPVPIVEYITESVVGARIDEIMDPVRDELTSEDPDVETAWELFTEIEDVRVLDVTCGSGSFLIKAYDMFRQAYEEYDKLARDAVNQGGDLTSYTGRESAPTDYRTKILENNLFGVDLDNQATEITSVNLLLKALRQDEKLPPILEENIKQGNSLLDGTVDEVAAAMNGHGDDVEALRPFKWRDEFQVVFNEESDGFDAIIGNPPWGADMDSYEAFLEHDEHGYELASGQYNSYELLLELGDRVLKPGGTLGFIIPDTIFNDEYVDLREWLIENHQLDQIHKLGEGVFGDDVFTATAIIQYTNTTPNEEHVVSASLLRKEDRDKMMGAGGEALASLIEAKRNPTKQARYRAADDYRIDVWAAEADYEILDTMREGTVDWNAVIDNGRGDETGRDGKVMKCPFCLDWDTYPAKRAESKGGGYYPKTCNHCGEKYELEEAASTAQIVSDEATSDRDTPIYYGEHVNRYRLTGNGYINTDIDGDWLNDDERFDPPKLLIRRTGLGFFCTIDYSDTRALKANLVFRLLDDREEPFDQYELEYFLGFLNSRAMLYYYAKTQGIVEWQSFPRHTQTFIMSLPIPEIDFDDEEERAAYDEFVALVRDAADPDAKVDDDVDWEIEQRVLDFYGIPESDRPRIWAELKELQRMRIVRELFPEETDD